MFGFLIKFLKKSFLTLIAKVKWIFLRIIFTLLANSMVWDRLNRLTLVVHDAMKQYGVDVVKPRSECSTLQCQIQKAFEHDESWPDYEQLLQNYIMEEARLIRDKF